MVPLWAKTQPSLSKGCVLQSDVGPTVFKRMCETRRTPRLPPAHA